MRRELFASLRLRLWLLVALALIPALGLMFYSAAERRRQAVKEVRDQALRVAQLISSDQERRIDGTHYLLVALAHVPDVRDGDAAECERFLASLLKDNPLYANFGLADRAGEIICSAVPMDKPVNIADRTYFVGAVVARDFAVGEFQLGRVTGVASINFGYPVFDADGRVQAVVFAAMDLSWLNHLVAAVDLPESATLVVIDRKGTIIARYPNPLPWVGQSDVRDPLFQAMLAQGQGTAELHGIDGIPRIYAFTGLRGLPEAGYVSIGIPQALAYAPARRALVRNLAGLGGIGVLALAAAWIGGEVFIVRRIRALVQAAKRLSAGDLGTRTGLPHGSGELNQLAAAFDEMAASLEKHELQQRLEEDLRRHNEALEEENRRVREVNQLKSEFVSLVSHELRTPLTAISGYLDLLLEDQSGEAAKSRELLSIVKRNTDRLVILLDDLLDLSRIESGKFELNLAAVDAMALIAEVVSLLQPQLEAKDQQLTVDQAEALPLVQGDADRIRRILINLLSNAHKYTPPGGHIWVTAHRLQGWVQIDVRDNGIGLSLDEQAHLFDKFFRAQQPATQEVGGTGLGLPITRLLVERHGGRITVTSAPGQGSTFSFTLPVAEAIRER
ncbi:MAG: sensor histidine kinase [Candidatus Entotheonellia bacterium]